MFVDRAKIQVQAGRGGNGCESFYFQHGMRFKRRDGGDGGLGGNVIIRADVNIATLLDFKYRRHYKAGSGKHGSGNNKKGKDGEHCLILVPPGTIVRNADVDCLIRDLNKPDEQVIVAKGGIGGKGNQRGGPPTEGRPGDSLEISLELKLIADVSLIGYPNAGKSSLLNLLSQAKSKVANFPFTTLSPVLGVLKPPDSDNKLVIADIPGLIKDAHKGKGLGIEFLRHIERTKMLLFVIDMAGTDGRDPWDDYHNLINELRAYDPDLLKRPYLLAANKMDMEQAVENLKVFKKTTDKKVFLISCEEKKGIEALSKALLKEFNIK